MVLSANQHYLWLWIMLFSSGSKGIRHMAFTVQGQTNDHEEKLAASRLCASGAACASRATAIEMNNHANGKQISW